MSVQSDFSPYPPGVNLGAQPALDLVVIAVLVSTCSTAAALLFTFAPCYAFKKMRSSVKQPFTLVALLFCQRH